MSEAPTVSPRGEILLDALNDLTAAYLTDVLKEAEAYVRWLQDKEELRAAENLVIEKRTANKTLGSNDHSRRAQLDTDCGAERQQAIDSECEYIRATAERQATEAALITARLGLATTFTTPHLYRLVDQNSVATGALKL